MDFHNRKLIKSLKKLNKWEFSAFKKYLHSPEFSTITETISDFFNDFSQDHPIYPESQGHLIEAHFLGKFENELGELNRTCNLIHQIFEKWMVYKEAMDNPAIYGQLLAKAYYRMGTTEQFKKRVNKAIEQIEQEPMSSYERNHALFNIEFFKLHHPENQNFESKITPEKLSIRLDNYYVSQKLRLYCQMLTRKNLVAQIGDKYFIESVKNYARKQKDNIHFQLYLNLIDLYENKNPVLIPKIKQDFEQHHLIFDQLEKAIYLKLFLNYIIRLRSSGQTVYTSLQLELYQLLTKLNLLTVNNQISSASFNNIVGLACSQKNFEYAKNFIKQYSTYLPEDIQSELTAFSNASIDYHKENYAIATQKLEKISFKGIPFKLVGRSLLLKCYYERFLGDKSFERTLKDEIINYYQFVKRNRILADDKKEPYLAFIKALKQLVKCWTKPVSTRQKLQATLLDYYENTPIRISNKEWVIQKIKELKTDKAQRSARNKIVI